MSYQTKLPKLAAGWLIPKSNVVLFSPGANVIDCVTPVDELPSLSLVSSAPWFGVEIT